MKTRISTGIILIVAAASTVSLLADARLTYKVTEGTSAVSTMLIGQGKIRSDMDAGTSAIIDPTEGSMTLLDHTKKTFTKIGKAELKQMTDGMAQLDQMMANLPPEALQMMRGRMAGAGGGAAEPAVTADTGQTSTVAGKSCRIFKTTQGTKVTAEYCLADASAIDLSAADRATVVASMAWAKQLTETMSKSPLLGNIGSKTPFQAGLVPLRTTMIDASGARNTTEFVSVATATLPAELFKVPSDYKEQKLPAMGRGRGGLFY
jgi:hypothetical protein